MLTLAWRSRVEALDRVSTATAFRRLLSAIAIGSCLFGCARESKPRPVNVLLIMIDTLRADHLSTYGYDRSTSPILDQFGVNGVVFENHRAQAPCTFPSVNSLFTSRYPVHLLQGQDVQDLGITPGIPTLAEMLSERGYDTYAVSASPIVRVTPSRFNKVGGFGRGFDRFEEKCVWRDATCVNRIALPIIREHSGSETRRPFFLYLHYMDPHAPYRPPEGFPRRFAGAYKGEREWVANGDPNPLAAMLYQGGEPVEYGAEDVEYLRSLYDDEIAFADSEIGLLLNEIELQGLTSDTLVVIVADHGESFMENGHMKHCYNLFEHNVRTPLMIRGPGVERGRRVAVATSNIDVLPTLLELVDERLQGHLKQEAESMPRGIQGRSLRPLIESTTAREEDSLAFASIGSLRMATDGRFKLIKDLQSGEFMLFDLETDPRETTNVVMQQRRPFRSLEQRLDTWIVSEEGEGTAMERTVETQRQLKALGYIQ